MATATFTVSGPAVGSYQRGYEFSDADAGRIMTAWGAKIGNSDPQLIVDGIAQAFLDFVLMETHEYHKRAAARAAADAVVAVVATPIQ